MKLKDLIKELKALGLTGASIDKGVDGKLLSYGPYGFDDVELICRGYSYDPNSTLNH